MAKAPSRQVLNPPQGDTPTLCILIGHNEEVLPDTINLGKMPSRLALYIFTLWT